MAENKQEHIDLSPPFRETEGLGLASAVPLSLIECPRDAMQGWPHFIPTEKKIEYISSLLQVGFHTIDAGSFVSPKAIPQMADTKEVLVALDVSQTNTKLLVIAANERGAEEAAATEKVSYIGYPFSISETFQRRNTNSSIAESIKRVEAIQTICENTGKQLVIYLSMAFGNPYGDPYNEEVLLHWAAEVAARNVATISLADTVGLATPYQISAALETLIPAYPHCTIGVHLHTSAGNWRTKLKAAVDAGCRRIDGALNGIGGCPMAGDGLVGNMATEQIISYLDEHHLPPSINKEALQKSLQLAGEIFV